LSYATGFAAFEVVFVAFVVFWNRKHAPAKITPTSSAEKSRGGLAEQGA
jgi:hypothetical protein